MAEFRHLLMQSDVPLLSKGLVNHWEQIKWNQEKWISVLGEETYPFRSAANKCSEIPVRETECDINFMKMKHFFACAEYPAIIAERWYYLDYKNMNEYGRFKHVFAEDFNWGDVGFPEKNVKESYVWIGSVNAHTSCHYDTYGFNVVAQLYGRKRWFLFPPTESETLHPTRVPFEESTVGSKINFACKLGLRGKQLQNCFVVDLDPGDILYVPPRWWHFVTNQNTAISVNVWIPIDTDHESRLEEALVSSYINSVTKLLPEDQKNKLINPTESLEEDYTPIIEYCINKMKMPRVANNGQSVVTEDAFSLNDQSGKFERIQPFVGDVKELISCRCNGEETLDTQSSQNLNLLENIIDSFCHPNIISQVKDRLLENINKSATP